MDEEAQKDVKKREEDKGAKGIKEIECELGRQSITPMVACVHACRRMAEGVKKVKRSLVSVASE